MTYLRYFVVTLSIAILGNSCQQKHYKKISPEVYESVIKKCFNKPHKTIVLYYMNGDCSFCIANAVDLERKSDHLGEETVFLAKSTDRSIAEYAIKKARLRSCVFYDTTDTFDKYLSLGTIYQIDTEGNILDAKPDAP